MTVNCSAAVRNFYIESSLGTFISEQSGSAGGRSRAAATKVNSVVYSDINASADQISKQTKMGRQRTNRRRRRRRKRSPPENEDEHSDEEVEEDEVVLFGRDVSDSVTRSSRSKRRLNDERSNAKSAATKGVMDAEEVDEEDNSQANAHHRDNTNESSNSGIGSADKKVASAKVVNSNSSRQRINVTGEGEKTRNKREGNVESGGSLSNCRNKNVWIENFVYSPTFTVNWRFSQSELQQLNQTTRMVISFR